MNSKQLMPNVLNFIGIASLLFSFLVVGFNYNLLPETIPTHFNSLGEPDGYGSKRILFFLPCVGLVLFCLIAVVPKLPKSVINYPYKITPENEGRQYENALNMMLVMRTLIPILFSYLTYRTIQTGLGNANGLGGSLTFVFLGLTFGILGFFIYRGYQLR